MCPDLDLEGIKDTTMEASTSKDCRTFVRNPRDKNMRPATNNEHKIDTVTSLNKQDQEICNDEDMINCTTDYEGTSVQSQSEDATACSSSSFSDAGNHESDDEVVSQLRGDPASMRGYGGSTDLFPGRKKKLTSHWRKYIHPLMWRCKWAELQIKKFQSQAKKYDEELEKYDQAKKLKYGNSELEGLCGRSMPFNHDFPREKPMKRKIRKRNEESDAEVYFSQHNLFSYLATDKSANKGVTIDDDQTNSATSTEKNLGNEFKVPDELLSLDFRDDYFMEPILWKIEVADSQIDGMKSRLNTLMTENDARISYAEELSLLESNNALANTAPSTNGNGPSAVASFASQLMKLNMDDDQVKPKKSDPSHGESCLQKDVNEPTEQPSVASRKRTSDGILIYNRRAKKLQADSGAPKANPIEKLHEPKEEKGCTTALVSVSEDSSQIAQAAPVLDDVFNLTAPNYKKKRAARVRRKSAPSLWYGVKER